MGPKVVGPNPGTTLWGALGLPLGPSRALLGPPWAPPRRPCVHNAPPKHADVSFRFADLCFISPFVARCTFSLTHLSRNTIETNVFSLVLKLRCRCHFLTFAIVGCPRAPPGPPLGERSGPFWTALPPLKFRNGLLGAPGPSRGSLSGCHSFALG